MKKIMSILILLLLVLSIVGSAFAVSVNDMEASENTEDLFSQLTFWDKVKYVWKEINIFDSKSITSGAVCNYNITNVIAGEEEFTYTCEGHTNCVLELFKKADGVTTFVDEIYLAERESKTWTDMDVDARYVLNIDFCDNVVSDDRIITAEVQNSNTKLFWYIIGGLTLIGIITWLWGKWK